MPTGIDVNGQPRSIPTFYEDANNVLHYLTANGDAIIDGDVSSNSTHANTADFATQAASANTADFATQAASANTADLATLATNANVAAYAQGLLANATAVGNVAVDGVLSVNNTIKVSGNTGMTANVAVAGLANTFTFVIVGGIVVDVEIT
jgi:hypothetical protein